MPVLTSSETTADAARFQESLPLWRARLDTRFPEVDPVFEGCLADAMAVLSPQGLEAYVAQARTLGKLGRGVEPMLIFLAEWPQTARSLGEDALPSIAAAIHALYKSPNGKAIAPFLQSLAAVARRLSRSPAEGALSSREPFQRYLNLALDFMERTTGSIHGHHKTFASPGLPLLFEHAPQLLGLLSVGGLQRWVDYGIRNHQDHPERQRDYFSLRSADARAVLQRERRGTLLADHTRALDLYLLALWQEESLLVPYATAPFGEPAPLSGGPRALQPYYDDMGTRLPDVYEDRAGVRGLDRYRAALAHMAAHRRWSRPVVADNWSPFQRLAVETFEDARVDTLMLRLYPGLRPTLLRLHPHPPQGGCDPGTHSCLRFRLAMLSRAMLDPAHGYTDPDTLDFQARFQAALALGDSSTREMAELALSCVARIRRQSDQRSDVFFDHTEVDYRDDNRNLWIYIEAGDEEESFEAHRRHEAAAELSGLPPRHYPEWDHRSQTWRPDWVSLYERLQPSGSASLIDQVLARHAGLAKQIQRLLDLLKPQDKVRIRFQEDGSELDLDVALRAWIDLQSGAAPDGRINMSHRTDGRDISVLLLLDLSASLNERVPGGEHSVLDLSREAVTLLAWAIEQLGDPLAIAGFHSNTRHDVRYLHIKGFNEGFDDGVKARLAGMEAGFSTRMGAALRHAGHYLAARSSDKKLLLILTDGEPSDIDSPDARTLIEDAREAVRELSREGIYTHCISLDPQADAYVNDIFGGRHTVVENVQSLPERLPQLFLSLTR
jgi:nitric oxide reductase NorD protein